MAGGAPPAAAAVDAGGAVDAVDVVDAAAAKAAAASSWTRAELPALFRLPFGLPDPFGGIYGGPWAPDRGAGPLAVTWRSVYLI